SRSKTPPVVATSTSMPERRVRRRRSRPLHSAPVSATSMKVGVQLPEVERPVGWPELAEMAALIESAGFDSVWVGEHLLYEIDGARVGPWEAWSVLAAVAATTERVEIGPLVAALPFHNPAL